MSYGKLSNPWKLEGSDSFQILKDAQRKFHDIFIAKDRRPYYKGKFIFFDTNFMADSKRLPFPERFMHICSIENKGNYTIFPCNNDESYFRCANKCEIPKATSAFQLIERSDCLYRASRIHWIPEIINLANNGDENVKTWKSSERSNNGKSLIRKKYIRYEVDLADYLIILKEERRSGELSFYRFITAYPVFLKRNKNQFNQAYEAYIKEKTEAETPLK